MKRAAAIYLTAVIGSGAIVTSDSLAGFRSGVYRGKTRDGYRLSFRASKTRIDSFAFKSRFHCNNRATFVAKGGPYQGLRLHSGRFDISRSDRSHSLSVRLTGRLSGKQASGTITRMARFNSAGRLDPAGTRTCTSKTSWSARSS